MLQSRAAHHLRADETGPVASALAAKGLHRDTGHRRQHKAGRDLDHTDPPGLPKTYLHRAKNSIPRLLLTTLPGVATIRARDGASAPRFFIRRGASAVKEVILTPEGYEKLKREIEELSTTRRREVAERIRIAREFGDIAKKDIAKDVVSVGSKVKLRDVAAKETVEYHIVGSAEANPAENKLSNESPVGKAIIGKKKGETVEVTAPRGKMKFKIMEIKAA